MGKIICFQCFKEKRNNNCKCGYWHHLLSPDHPEMDEKIQQYLNMIRNNHQLNEVLKKYIN